MSGREPPVNLQAEASVLGAILIKPSTAHEVMSVLIDEDFYLPAHRDVFAALSALVARQLPIDILTLTEELKTRGGLPRLEGGESYLVALAAGVPTAENIEYYIGIVRSHSRRRRMIALCADISTRCFGDPTPGDDLFAEFESEVFRLTSERTGATPFPVTVLEVLDTIEARSRSHSELRGIASGITKLDYMTDGWQPEHLIIVAGRPGMGKSAIAMNNFGLAAAVDQGVPTLIFSLEMTKAELTERLIAGKSRIDGTRLRKGALSSIEWRDVVYPAANELRAAPIEIDDQGGQTIAQLQAKIRRFRANDQLFPPLERGASTEHARGLVIVDYLQLVRGTGGTKQPREQAVAEITQGLKAVAKSTHLPIIAVAQLNRELEKRADKRPQLSDLRESGAIEQDADIVLFIHRADYYPDEKDAVPGQAELLVRKNRHGDVGSCFASWIKEITRFENFAFDEAAPDFHR